MPPPVAAWLIMQGFSSCDFAGISRSHCSNRSRLFACYDAPIRDIPAMPRCCCLLCPEICGIKTALFSNQLSEQTTKSRFLYVDGRFRWVSSLESLLRECGMLVIVADARGVKQSDGS